MTETMGSNTSAPDKHPELNKLCDEMRDPGMAVTKSWKDMWGTAIRYVWDQQLEGWKLKEDWQYIVVNRIRPLLMQTIAKLSNNHPKIQTQAWDDEEPNATEFAEKWAGHLQYLWESPYELSMRLKLITGLLSCGLFGYMVGKTFWEAKGSWDITKKKWIGKTKHMFIHPASFWADPAAEHIIDAENCGTVRRVKLEWAQKRWPDFKEEIEREAFDSSDTRYYEHDVLVYDGQKGVTVDNKRRNFFSQIVSLILRRDGAGSMAGTGVVTQTQRYVHIEEIYWKDYAEKEVEIKDNIPSQELIDDGTITVEPETGLFLDTKTGKPFADSVVKKWPRRTINKYTEPTFPTGRFVIRIGRTILNPEEKDQVYGESRWPFTVMPYHILPFMWQGNNAVEPSRNNNDMLNITVSSMVQQVRRTADPERLIEANALARGRDGKIRTTKLFGLGKLIVMAKGKIQKIANLIYTPLDPAVPILAAALKQDIDDQMFMQDVARGAAQKGQQTKAEIIRLNQNALDYTGMQGIFLDRWIDDTVTLLAELAQRNYEPGRLAKMTTDGVQTSVKMDQTLFDVRFDVNIVPGSTLPFDEVKKQNEHVAVYKMLESPIPNPMIEEMLMVFNISKRKEILARYGGLQLFRQFIQMGQLLVEAQSEPEVQKIMERVAQIPGLQQLMQLLLQAGQLAPQMGAA